MGLIEYLEYADKNYCHIPFGKEELALAYLEGVRSLLDKQTARVVNGTLEGVVTEKDLKFYVSELEDALKRILI